MMRYGSARNATDAVIGGTLSLLGLLAGAACAYALAQLVGSGQPVLFSIAVFFLGVGLAMISLGQQTETARLFLFTLAVSVPTAFLGGPQAFASISALMR
jgi:hypothetical protein